MEGPRCCMETTFPLGLASRILGLFLYPHQIYYITYMGNLHMFNNYNVEAFTYHIQLELCVIYDTIDVMTYFTFIILYVVFIV